MTKPEKPAAGGGAPMAADKKKLLAKYSAALKSLKAVNVTWYDDNYDSINRDGSNCTAPGSGFKQLAYSLQQCYQMVKAAEKSRGISYTHIIRIRPDQLWSEAHELPPPRVWQHTTSVLAPTPANEAFAIVPRSAASSYFNVYTTLREGCSLLEAGLRLGRVKRSTHCPPGGTTNPECQLRFLMHTQGVPFSSAFCDGEELHAPPIGTLCSKEVPSHVTAGSNTTCL